MYRLGSKANFSSLTGICPAIFTVKSEVSKDLILLIPDFPLISSSQVFLTLGANGVTIPIPVTTTLVIFTYTFSSI
jgi:hypothetical protein